MDIRRLEYFTHIAEIGSINRAAEHLRISQPALSRQIHLLEQELGVMLFVRHRRGMELTREGGELLKRLTGPLRQVGLALQDVRSLSGMEGGSVVVGMPSSTSHIFAGPLARRVAASAPNIAMRIIEGHAGSFVRSLERGEIDIALLYGSVTAYRCAIDDLLNEELMVVGPPDCSLSPETPISWNRIATLPLILPSPANQPDVIRQIIATLTEISGTRPHTALVADSFLLTKSYVKAGLGYSFLPSSVFGGEAAHGEFRFAPIEPPGISRKLVMAINLDCAHPRATSRVKRMICEELAALTASGSWPAKLCFDHDV